VQPALITLILNAVSCGGSDKPASTGQPSGSNGTGGSSGAAAGNPSGGGQSGGGAPVSGGVTIAPASPHVVGGATVQFTAAVNGKSESGATWSVKEGDTGGTISATGLYTAPKKDGTYHVNATVSKQVGEATVFVGTPSDCSALDSVKGWERVTPAGLTTATSLSVDPFDPATVWLAGNGGFFKSVNCGATFEHINSGRNGAIIDTSTSWSIAVDPVDQGTIYLVGAYGGLGLWKTTDGGQNFDQLFGPESEWAKVAEQNFVNNVSMDPNDHLHLIVTQHGTCKGFAHACMAETTDGGKNWRLFDGPKGWGEGGGAQIVDTKTWIWGGAQSFFGLQVTTDAGATWKEALAGGQGDANGEFTTRPLARATDGALYITSMQGVLRSTDGVAWTNVGMGRLVSIAFSSTSIFVADQWTPNFLRASFADLKTWTKMDAPQIDAGAGCPYLDYDPAHHVLYASCFKEGTWRAVVE
jgi:Bacterial Ig-like domain (group 2)